MPIDYQQIYIRIKEIGAGARERKKTLDERRVLARKLLAEHSSELDFLRSKVDAAKQADANIRCALPLNEPLASSYSDMLAEGGELPAEQPKLPP